MKERRRIKEFQRWPPGRVSGRIWLRKITPIIRVGPTPSFYRKGDAPRGSIGCGRIFCHQYVREGEGIVSLLLKYEYENQYFSVTSLESESKFAHYESHRQLFCVTDLFGAFLPRRSCTSLRHRQGPSASVLSRSLAFFGGMHDGAIKVSRRRIRQSPPPPPHAIFRGR